MSLPVVLSNRKFFNISSIGLFCCWHVRRMGILPSHPSQGAGLKIHWPFIHSIADSLLRLLMEILPSDSSQDPGLKLHWPTQLPAWRIWVLQKLVMDFSEGANKSQGQTSCANSLAVQHITGSICTGHPLMIAIGVTNGEVFSG